MQPVPGKKNEFIRTKEEQQQPTVSVQWVGTEWQKTPAGVFKPGQTLELTAEQADVIRSIGDSRFLINGQPISPLQTPPETPEEEARRYGIALGTLSKPKTAADVQREIEASGGKVVVEGNEPPKIIRSEPVGGVDVGTPEAERLSEARNVETQRKRNR